MIDVHSHIIPEIDDGARSWEEAVSMCRMAWQDGTKAMAATPHRLHDLYHADGADIAQRIAILREKLREEAIGLEIVQGAEVYSSPDLPSILERDASLTLNGSGRWFLLEFPHSVIPPHSDEFVFQLRLRNLTPIVVHPERNPHVQGNAHLLKRMIDCGAFSQVTAMSFTGGFGLRARDCAFELLGSGLVHAIASDAHNMSSRPPILSQAYRLVAGCVGGEKALDLFETFPRKILNGVDE